MPFPGQATLEKDAATLRLSFQTEGPREYGIWEAPRNEPLVPWGAVTRSPPLSQAPGCRSQPNNLISFPRLQSITPRQRQNEALKGPAACLAIGDGSLSLSQQKCPPWPPPAGCVAPGKWLDPSETSGPLGPNTLSVGLPKRETEGRERALASAPLCSLPPGHPPPQPHPGVYSDAFTEKGRS